MKKNRCGINSYECFCPANLDDGPKELVLECYACGMRVCKRCSQIYNYYAYGMQRICNNCLEDMKK